MIQESHSEGLKARIERYKNWSLDLAQKSKGRRLPLSKERQLNPHLHLRFRLPPSAAILATEEMRTTVARFVQDEATIS